MNCNPSTRRVPDTAFATLSHHFLRYTRPPEEAGCFGCFGTGYDHNGHKTLGCTKLLAESQIYISQPRSSDDRLLEI